MVKLVGTGILIPTGNFHDELELNQGAAEYYILAKGERGSGYKATYDCLLPGQKKMTSNYIAERYITVDEALDFLGFTKTQQQTLNTPERARITQWVEESNSRGESDIAPYAESIPLIKGTVEYTNFKNFLLNFVVYKRRSFIGSPNAKEALDSYNSGIEITKEYLRKLPTSRTDPIATDQTDSLQDYLIPYSQTLGLPPDVLY